MTKKLLYSLICATFAFAGTAQGQGRAPTQAYSPPSPPERPASDLGGEPTAAKANESQSRKTRTKKPDRVSTAESSRDPGERFPDTPVGRALRNHLQILVDISAGADERKERSLEELRKNPKEASQALLAAYHAANSKDFFRRWLLSLTLSELGSNEAYPGLHEIAHSKVPAGLKDNDLEGSQLSNESAIRQNSVWGLILLARKRPAQPRSQSDLGRRRRADIGDQGLSLRGKRLRSPRPDAQSEASEPISRRCDTDCCADR
jgi:hypothetical protein